MNVRPLFFAAANSGRAERFLLKRFRRLRMDMSRDPPLCIMQNERFSSILPLLQNVREAL